jgi:tripartite-type tricarboxylate transporter receptor subunit TctC
VRAGKLKSDAVSGIKRSPLAPDLPTIDEAGLKGYELTAGLPPMHRRKLRNRSSTS